MARCEPFLKRQVALVQPKLILLMGRFAVKQLLKSDDAIGKLRGRVHRYEGIPVIVTYHPAYLLRNLPDKAKAWEDLCLAKATADARSPCPEGAPRPTGRAGRRPDLSARRRSGCPASCYFGFFFGRSQSANATCLARPIASEPGGTVLLIVEPPPMVAPSPIVTGRHQHAVGAHVHVGADRRCGACWRRRSWR